MKYSRVMCLVRGDHSDADTIDTAIGLIAGNNRGIRFTHVIVVERRFALDGPNPSAYAEAERVLREAEQMAGQRLLARGSILQARSIAPVLVREALDHGADAIVAAAKIVTTINGKTMDRDSEYLMANAPCAVVLVRDSMPGFETNTALRELQAANGSALGD